MKNINKYTKYWVAIPPKAEKSEMAMEEQILEAIPYLPRSIRPSSLVEIFGLGKMTVSYYLANLRNSGKILSVKRGRSKYYFRNERKSL